MKMFMTLIFIFIISGCGTDTGNPFRSIVPGNPSKEDDSLEEIKSTFSYQLRESICGKLIGCYNNIEMILCKKSINALTHLDAPLGVSDYNF